MSDSSSSEFSLEHSDAPEDLFKTFQKAFKIMKSIEDLIGENEGSTSSSDTTPKDEQSSSTDSNTIIDTSIGSVTEFVPVILNSDDSLVLEDEKAGENQSMMEQSAQKTKATEDDKMSTSLFKILDRKGPGGAVTMVAIEEPNKIPNKETSALQKDVIRLIQKNQAAEGVEYLTPLDKIEQAVGKLSDRMLRIIKCFAPYFKIIINDAGISLEERYIDLPETDTPLVSQGEAGSVSTVQEVAEVSSATPKRPMTEEKNEIRECSSKMQKLQLDDEDSSTQPTDKVDEGSSPEK